MRKTLAALDAEWRECSRSPEAAEALRSWAAGDPALAELPDLAAVLRARLDPEAAPRILAALARLAPGDELAARTLLRALMPGLVTMAAGAMAEDPTAFDEMVSLAWQRIRTYPATRTGSVAGNVLLDVRKWYRCHRDIEAPRGPRSRHRASQEPTAPSAEEVVVGRQLVDEVVAAGGKGVISPAAVRLVLRTRYVGVPLAEAAADEAATVEQAWHIRWKAERRLRPALQRAS